MKDFISMRNVFACPIFYAVIAFMVGGLSCPLTVKADGSDVDSTVQIAPLESIGKAPAGESQTPDKASEQAKDPEQRLTALFNDLRRTTNQAKATRIAAQINNTWLTSGSATVDLLSDWANTATLERRYASAIDFLDEAIALNPDYAEVWNRRARVFYLQRDYDRAMADLSKTLELEPRHFGALMGMAAILQTRGLKEQAMRAYEKVLAIYPMMQDAQTNLNDLAEELADTRT